MHWVSSKPLGYYSGRNKGLFSIASYSFLFFSDFIDPSSITIEYSIFLEHVGMNFALKIA